MDRRFSVLILLVIVAVNIFWGIGGTPLLDPDEPVYAETAREMIVFKDYLSPRIYNDFWYDKPPMYYWLVAGTFNTFGVSDFGARLPSAVMGILTVCLVYLLVKRLFDADTGFWSAIILGTCVEFFYLGKAAVTDMTLLFFMTGALLCFLDRHYWLMYVFMALGTLTKGPIGLVFPVLIIGLYLLVSAQWSLLKKMHLPVGILLYTLIAGPWYYAMFQAHGQIFIDTFLGFHNITRFTTPEHPTRVLWYYYFPVLILGLFPWTGMLFSALKASISESSGKDFQNMIFVQIWWLFVFVFFSISQTKLVSYIFPLFPPLAIIIGWNLARLGRERFPQREYILAGGSFLMFTLLASGWLVGGKMLPELAFGSMILAGITMVLALGIVLAYLKFKDVFLAAWLHVVTGIVTMVVVFTFMLPSVTNRFSVKAAVDYYRTNCDQKVAVHVDKFLRPGFMFYARTPGVELKPELTNLREVLTTSNPQYLIMRGLVYRRLPVADTTKLQEVFSKDDIYIFKSK
ncbi:MAG: glycosyltransferase family 39 protein [Acidaminococcaceae bacterium]